jgi:hypothetical protein
MAITEYIRNVDRAILNAVLENTVRLVNKCLEIGGGTLNITCILLYCNNRVHRDFLIILYEGRSRCNATIALQRQDCNISYWLCKTCLWFVTLPVLLAEEQWLAHQSSKWSRKVNQNFTGRPYCDRFIRYKLCLNWNYVFYQCLLPYII